MVYDKLSEWLKQIAFGVGIGSLPYDEAKPIATKTHRHQNARTFFPPPKD